MIKLAAGGSAIRAMFEEGKRLAAQYGPENVFDFSIGNPYFAPPDAVKDAIVDIITNDEPMHCTRLPRQLRLPRRPQGRGRLPQPAASAPSYDENNIMMTVGAAGGLSCTILTPALQPGRRGHLSSPPTFSSTTITSATPTPRSSSSPPAAENGFMPDIDAIAAAVTPKTKAIILNNPNNPTGVIYSGGDAQEVLGALLEEKGKEFGTVIYVIADEPYRELAYDGAEVPWLPDCCQEHASSATPGRRASPCRASASAISSSPPTSWTRSS